MEKDPFRIRGHVADFDAIVGQLVSRSAATRERLEMHEARYGEGPSETVDIFLPPDAEGPRPVHVFIHGGYWRMFSKRDYSLIAETVTEAGAIAVIVDYALMPSVGMEIIVDQMARMRRWVVDNIVRFGGDASRLTISGHSAGAQLATKSISLPARSRMVRDVKEFFTAATTGTEIRVTSPVAIQMLGLLGNDSSRVVLPVAPATAP